jgi:hypothetical protein
MFLFTWLRGLIDHPGSRQRGSPHGRGRPAPRLVLELLEDRLCPSGGYLLVASFGTDSVQRYDETSGAYVDTFVDHHSGGLYQPFAPLFGPDHELYVSEGPFANATKEKSVLRYDGVTGAFQGDYTNDVQLTSPRAILFGPDGNLYVADGNDPDFSGRVLRFQGPAGLQPGAFLDEFVPAGYGGLSHPVGMVFGPDGNLYVSSAATNNVLRYNGTTGEFLGAFVPSRSAGLLHPKGLVFGPDGDLYVAHGGITFGSEPNSPSAVLRFQGPFGSSPGAFIDTFATAASAGLNDEQAPLGALLFGPGGNLYVDNLIGSGKVLRFDGTTGAFLNEFVPQGRGGMSGLGFMTFTETDPTTLSFTGTSADDPATNAAAHSPAPQPPGLHQAVAGAFTSTLETGPDCPSPVGICTLGILTGGLQASYDFTMLTLVPDAQDSSLLHYTGTSVIRTDNGTELFGMDSGVMELGADGRATFTTTVQIVGGTRQYKGAAGEIVASGVLDFTTGLAAGTYTGEIDRHEGGASAPEARA